MINFSDPLNPPSLLELKLPRAVEADPRKGAIQELLKKDLRPLWEKSSLQIAHTPLWPSLEKSLKTLLHRRQLERGLERIEVLLNNEQKGLQALQKKQGTPPSQRVSRLFLVSNDGSERFYRACEKILLQHRDRVLMICIDEASSKLTQELMGDSNKILKALLVSGRDAVSNVLYSLVEHENDER
jgi:hypothetical protein